MRLLLQSRAGNPRLVVTCLLVAVTLAVSGCTRDPFNTDRPVTRYDNKFTYTTILSNEDIQYLSVAGAPDGRMAVAAFTGLRELKVLESTSGAWSEIKTITGNGIIARVVDLAAGASGAWWVVTSNTDTGVKLYRIGGPGDAVYVPPDSVDVPWDALDTRIAVDWDSLEAQVAIRPDGSPLLVLRATDQGLIHAALADTGWAFSLLQNSTDTGFAWELAVDDADAWHTVYQPSTSALEYYSRVGTDSTHSSVVEGAGAFLSMVLDADNLPYVGGQVLGASQLRLWHWRPSTPGVIWPSEELPAGSNEPYLVSSSIAVESDQTPHFFFAQFHGSLRFDLMWATRSPETAGFGWSVQPVIRDIPHLGSPTRLRCFRIVLDTFERPNFFFLTAPTDQLTSDLVVAVPKN